MIGFVRLPRPVEGWARTGLALVFPLLAAWEVADMALVMWGPAAAPVPHRAVAPRDEPTRPQADVQAAACLFGGCGAEKAPERPPPSVPRRASPLEGVAFHGAIIGSDGGVAFISTPQSRVPLAYRKGGAPVTGLTVAHIEPNRVLLSTRSGGEIELAMGGLDFFAAAGRAPDGPLTAGRGFVSEPSARGVSAPDGGPPGGNRRTAAPGLRWLDGEGAWQVADAGPGTPLRAAGFAEGDRVLLVNGRPPDALPADAGGWAFAAGDGAAMRFSVVRNGRPLTLALNPEDFYGKP